MEKLIEYDSDDNVPFIKDIVHEKMIKLGFSLDRIETVKKGAASRDEAYVSYKKENDKGVINVLFVYYPSNDIFIIRKYYRFILKYFRAGYHLQREDFISIRDSQDLKKIKDIKEWKKFILNTLDYIKEKELTKL